MKWSRRISKVFGTIAFVLLVGALIPHTGNDHTNLDHIQPALSLLGAIWFMGFAEGLLSK